jgi:hypothetical protein
VRASDVNVDDDDDNDDNDEGEDDDDDDESDHDDGVIEVHGAVSGLGGNCPELTFKVGDRAVKTSNSTVFSEITCLRVQNTVRVEVKGRPGVDGTLAATRVEADD